MRDGAGTQRRARKPELFLHTRKHLSVFSVNSCKHVLTQSTAITGATAIRM